MAQRYQGRAAVILSLAFLIIAPTAMAAQDALEEATQAYMNEAKTLWTAQQEFQQPGPPGMPKAARQMNPHPKTKPGTPEEDYWDLAVP